MNRLLNDLAILLIFFMCLTLAGPVLDYRQREVPTEEQQTARREARKLAAIQEMCGGENAVAVELDDGSFQCKTKNGKNTLRVKL